MNKFLATGAFLGMLAVIIGAFGAHILENMLSAHALERFHTGVSYQFYHVAALLSVGILSARHQLVPRSLQLSGVFFILGIVLFSGSLYLYALTGIKSFGMVTPIGGLGFIAGWVCFMIYALRSNK